MGRSFNQYFIVVIQNIFNSLRKKTKTSVTYFCLLKRKTMTNPDVADASRTHTPAVSSAISCGAEPQHLQQKGCPGLARSLQMPETCRDTK